ncbi:MAG TPA: DUF2532 domain-containing protein [Rickettsia endosymbiont of Columbicola hoogstraali]|nr:DUF2532 domain-containing protein [Rickettsia endosymbiont of Columbicola hoogstraali]
MNIRSIICFVILVSAVKINADFNDTQVIETTQDIVIEQETIKLPWSDCTEIHKLFERKFSFSEKQVKKENKIHEEYRKFYLDHNNPSNFSMQFSERKTDAQRVERLISGFLKFCEDNFQTSNIKPNSLSYQIKKQQEQLFNNIRSENYKIYYKQRYYNNAVLPSHNK